MTADPPKAVRVGPFRLKEIIGRGGSAEVWSAVHGEGEGALEVAFKVLTARRSRHRWKATAFANEIRAVAGLDHPNILTVYDHGLVPKAAEISSGGALTAGSPWLATELMTGGTLREQRGVRPWKELRGVLLSLLEALAHAHARGIIHRDVKPRNVLCDDRGGIKLGDFGLAHTARHSLTGDPTDFTVGTPQYMAPEQFEQRVRDYGPWTDLYAVGCLTWEMVCGTAPFSSARTLDSLMWAHLTWPTPPPRPRISVPEGIQGWITRLMAKPISDRWRRASDAAWALRELGEATTRAVRPPPDPSEGDPDDTVPLGKLSPQRLQQRHRPRVSAAWQPPPFVDDWRRQRPRITRRRWLGAGLGLFAVRAIPMVDRDSERDRLWAQLRAVHERKEPRVVILSGPSGFGRSRLAGWLCERAHELGMANVVRGTHSPAGGPRDGLAPMLLRTMNAEGCDRDGGRRRISQFLHQLGPALDEDINALTELLFPEDGGRGGSGSPARRYGLLQRWLSWQSEERPVILRMKDVEWGSDALGLVRWLLERCEPGRSAILAVLTVNPEILAQRPVEQELIDRLLEEDRAESIPVGPLPRDATLEFIEQILDLHGSLATEVCERSGGNPLFVHRLVGDWVRRDLLVAGQDGLSLRPGVRVEIPDSLHQVWEQLIERFVGGRFADDAVALELAAIIGRQVDGSEWLAACELAGIRPAPGLLDALLEGGLAVLEPSSDGQRSWTFAHSMFPESLLRRCREQGRWIAHHLCVAEVLQPLPRDRVQSERLGRHLLEAGEPRQAVRHLTEAVMARLDRGQFRLADALVPLRDRAIEQLALPSDDPRWIEGWLIEARLCGVRGQFDDAMAAAERAVAAIDARPEEETVRPRWQRLRARAQMEGGRIAYSRGEFRRSHAWFVAAIGLYVALGDRSMAAHCLQLSAEPLLESGDLAGGLEQVEAAVAEFREIGDDSGLGSSHLCLGAFALARGDFITARRESLIARGHFERAGSTINVTNTYDLLGEVERNLGNLGLAEEHYRVALKRNRSTGMIKGMAVALVNLALVRLEQFMFAEVAAFLVEAEALGSADRLMRGTTSLIRLACEAGQRRWDTWAERMAQTRSEIAALGSRHPDLARVAFLAGELAQAGGRIDLAREGFELALSQYQGLQRDSDAQRVSERLGSL